MLGQINTQLIPNAFTIDREAKSSPLTRTCECSAVGGAHFTASAGEDQSEPEKGCLDQSGPRMPYADQSGLDLYFN